MKVRVFSLNPAKDSEFAPEQKHPARLQLHRKSEVPAQESARVQLKCAVFVRLKIPAAVCPNPLCLARFLRATRWLFHVPALFPANAMNILKAMIKCLQLSCVDSASVKGLEKCILLFPSMRKELFCPDLRLQ